MSVSKSGNDENYVLKEPPGIDKTLHVNNNEESEQEEPYSPWTQRSFFEESIFENIRSDYNNNNRKKKPLDLIKMENNNNRELEEISKPIPLPSRFQSMSEHYADASLMTNWVNPPMDNSYLSLETLRDRRGNQPSLILSPDKPPDCGRPDPPLVAMQGSQLDVSKSPVTPNDASTIFIDSNSVIGKIHCAAKVSVGTNCLFAPRCSFDKKSIFGDDCHFGYGCVFGTGTSFGRRCLFSADCKFSASTMFGKASVFGKNCVFMEGAIFAEECVFKGNSSFKDSLFDVTCKFGPNIKLDSRCRFSSTFDVVQPCQQTVVQDSTPNFLMPNSDFAAWQVTH